MGLLTASLDLNLKVHSLHVMAFINYRIASVGHVKSCVRIVKACAVTLLGAPTGVIIHGFFAKLFGLVNRPAMVRASAKTRVGEEVMLM